MKYSKIKNYIRDKVWLLKAAITSQISACVDFGISFAAFAWLGLGIGVSASLGAVGGGIVNCVLNYKWTFRASGSPSFCVAVKYILVWTGSLLLNTYGTELVTKALLASTFLDYYDISRNLRFSIGRLSVALLVSLFWNLRLQRFFVYRTVAADHLILKIKHHLTSFLNCRRQII